VYVEMILRRTALGEAVPLRMIWENGSEYEIDRVLEVRKAAAQQVGGAGLRYAVMIQGHRKYLFEDSGRWFVEAKN